MLSTRELSCYCFFGTQELAIKVFYPSGDHDISEVQNVGVIASMMESCMPAESDLPAWCIQWVRYCRVWLISVQSAAEFACSKWRICDFEAHPFGSLEDDTNSRVDSSHRR
jgi:hypothetical protein